MTLGTVAVLACSQHMRIDLKKITFGPMDQKWSCFLLVCIKTISEKEDITLSTLAIRWL